MSFYTYRGQATVVFELGLSSFDNEFKPSEEGERKCVDMLLSESPPPFCFAKAKQQGS